MGLTRAQATKGQRMDWFVMRWNTVCLTGGMNGYVPQRQPSSLFKYWT